MEGKDSQNGQDQDVGGATFCRSAVRISARRLVRGVSGEGRIEERT